MKKGKYEIRVCDTLVELDGLEFAVFGYGSLFVHRDHFYPKLWTVSETRTGYHVSGKHPTRKKAMEVATAEILENTPDVYQLVVQQCVDDDKRKGRPHTRYQQENHEN